MYCTVRSDEWKLEVFRSHPRNGNPRIHIKGYQHDRASSRVILYDRISRFTPAPAAVFIANYMYLPPTPLKEPLAVVAWGTLAYPVTVSQFLSSAVSSALFFKASSTKLFPIANIAYRKREKAGEKGGKASLDRQTARSAVRQMRKWATGLLCDTTIPSAYLPYRYQCTKSPK